MAVQYVSVDIPEQYGDSMSKRSRDIRAAHFVMDERRRRRSAQKAVRHIGVLRCYKMSPRDFSFLFHYLSCIVPNGDLNKNKDATGAVLYTVGGLFV